MFGISTVKYLINKIKKNIARKRIQAEAIERIEKEKYEWYNRPVSERLAMGTCEWVHLNWNGHREEFLINNLNVADLTVSGRYPNVIVYFMQLAKQSSDDEDEKIVEEIDMKKLKEEEQALYEEVARQSMVNPTFQEVYDSILKMREERGIKVEVKCIKDVIPYDFLQDLFRYHLEKWVNTIKKKLNASTLTASAE